MNLKAPLQLGFIPHRAMYFELKEVEIELPAAAATEQHAPHVPAAVEAPLARAG